MQVLINCLGPGSKWITLYAGSHYVVSAHFSGCTKALVVLICHISFFSIREKGEIEKRRNVIWSSGINHFHSAIINTTVYIGLFQSLYDH